MQWERRPLPASPSDLEATCASSGPAVPAGRHPLPPPPAGTAILMASSSGMFAAAKSDPRRALFIRRVPPEMSPEAGALHVAICRDIVLRRADACGLQLRWRAFRLPSTKPMAPASQEIRTFLRVAVGGLREGPFTVIRREACSAGDRHARMHRLVARFGTACNVGQLRKHVALARCDAAHSAWLGGPLGDRQVPPRGGRGGDLGFLRQADVARRCPGQPQRRVAVPASFTTAGGVGQSFGRLASPLRPCASRPVGRRFLPDRRALPQASAGGLPTSPVARPVWSVEDTYVWSQPLPCMHGPSRHMGVSIRQSRPLLASGRRAEVGLGDACAAHNFLPRLALQSLNQCLRHAAFGHLLWVPFVTNGDTSTRLQQTPQEAWGDSAGGDQDSPPSTCIAILARVRAGRSVGASARAPFGTHVDRPTTPPAASAGLRGRWRFLRCPRCRGRSSSASLRCSQGWDPLATHCDVPPAPSSILRRSPAARPAVSATPRAVLLQLALHYAALGHLARLRASHGDPPAPSLHQAPQDSWGSAGGGGEEQETHIVFLYSL